MKFLSVLPISLAIIIFAHGYPQAEKRNTKSEEYEKKSAGDDSDMYMEAVEQQAQETRVSDDEPAQDEQTFYPSFSPFQNPPLGHSRPFYFQQEAAYSQRPVSPFQQQLTYDTFRRDDFNNEPAAASSLGVLGSGNFGVIRGGTFYNDNDGEATNNYQNQYDPYYQNGHGRPSFQFGASNPRPTQHEQFANFRDFADINTPSYSQYVVVYANKNSTHHKIDQNQRAKEPKNIFETLAMLDLETTTTTTELPPTKKLSKSKRKLAKLLPEKKPISKKYLKATSLTSSEPNEPLLALS